MISVILPVRNGAQTLDTALCSLKNQTLTPEECLVIDDGSTDSTPEILSRWTQIWPAVRVIRTSGVGISRALNRGLDEATGDWIARMDADDRCHPLRMERQYGLAQIERSTVLVSCEVSHWTPNAQIESATHGMKRHISWANSIHDHNALERALWIDSPLPHPTWFVHRRAFDIVGFYDESLCIPEDYDWLHRFFRLAEGENNFRAVKVKGDALVDWAESVGRLTRTSPAYGDDAFNKVKSSALAWRLQDSQRDIVIAGLGPKGKSLLPHLKSRFTNLRGAVDVAPGRIGTTYQGLEVWNVTKFAGVVRTCKPVVLICLGTPEARLRCEQLCVELGLSPGRDFFSL